VCGARAFRNVLIPQADDRRGEGFVVMAVLDTAIQEKPKHFNDPWMAGLGPRLSSSFCLRLSSTSFPKSHSDCRESISKLADVETWIPDKTREARLSGMTP
jgi:hypothetical protein